MNKKKFLLLEISGEHGDLNKYMDTLCEGYLIGISEVVFAHIWGNNLEKANAIYSELRKSCELLKVDVSSNTFGYGSAMFERGGIGKISFDGLPSFSSLISIDEYKESKNIQLEQEQVAKVLTKIKNQPYSNI